MRGSATEFTGHDEPPFVREIAREAARLRRFTQPRLLDQPLNPGRGRPFWSITCYMREHNAVIERTGMRVNHGKLLPMKDVLRDLQRGSDTTSCDNPTAAIKAITGKRPCEKETQLELDAESAVAMRSAA